MDADAFRGFCLARAWLAGRDWRYTEESADLEQVRDLNAFLAPPGLDLDLRDEEKL